MAEKPISLSGLKTFLAQIKSKFLPITGGTINGDLRLQTTGENYGNKLNFGEGDAVYLYEYADDYLKIQAHDITLVAGDYNAKIHAYDDVDIEAETGDIRLTAENNVTITSEGGNINLNPGGGIFSFNKKIIRPAATFIVGNSGAKHSAVLCDYLCDGTADQTGIQAAINALPASGGKIVLLEGT